jgi:enoyl-CoA hydratase
VRALLIDKDRQPRWSPPTPGEVTPELVSRYLSPLPAGEELTF